MKKLLMVLIAVFTLCSCSSDDNDEITKRNTFRYENKNYPIDGVQIEKWGISLTSGYYTLSIHNLDLKYGEKYLLGNKESEAVLYYYGDGIQKASYVWDRFLIDKDSYIYIIKENGKTCIDAYVNDGKKSVRTIYVEPENMK